jgi:hypothetical protein
MFNFFRKKEPVLEFVSLLPEVAQLMPIEPSKDVKYNWVKEAMKDYKKIREEEDPIKFKFSHITRCPGINQIQKTGWIQRSWQDIAIKTNGDGKSFHWLTPIDQNKTDVDHTWKWPYVNQHPESLYAKFNPDPKSLKTVIKIQSPWMAYIPKGYYLMSMPIPYPDNKDFTASIGFLDPDFGPNFLNVQIFWHTLNDEIVIPAGTPLCQYILVKKNNVKSLVREYEKKDIDNLRLRAATIDNQWVSNGSKLKTYKWK